MIQTHQQLITISEEYNSLFSKNEFYPLQKAYTTPHFLVFSVRFPGKTKAIYIGRGNQYQGVFLADKLPPSYLRVQDRLLDYMRKFLVGARLGKLEIDEEKYVSLFHYKSEHPDNSILFGYKDRQLFFMRQSLKDVYLSWSGETIQSEQLIKLVDEFNPDKSNIQTHSKLWTIDDYLKEEDKKIGGQPVQKKKEKFLLKKIANISNDLTVVKNWALLEDDLINDRIDLSVDELNLYGQKIKMHGLSSLWAKRDFVFKKIKKLKKAEFILISRLEESKSELENVKNGDFEFELTKEKIIQPLWISHTKALKNESTEYNVKNFIIKKINGVIGLDALANDHIRSQCSKEHYWFHIENYPGAHCIVKTDDFSQFHQADLAAIASMLRDFSGLEITEIPILFTQLKQVKGVKGKKGEVIIKKPKHLRCLYINWKEIISIN